MTSQLGLFELPAPDVVAPEPVHAQCKKTSNKNWIVSDHACKHCGGRVLIQRRKNRTSIARCAECGVVGEGDHKSICCCGAELGALGHVLQCVRNPNVSKESPYQILVKEKVSHLGDPAKRQARPVRVEGF